MRPFFAAILLTTTAFADDTNAFHPFQVLSFTNTSKATITTNIHGMRVMLLQPLIEPSKVASITNGITLGQVVTNLGPGWMLGTESVGIICWSFSDGRELNVLPSSYSATDVLSTNRSNRAHFWFTTNSHTIPSK